MKRLGVVSYLNTRPLVHAFESKKLVHSFDLVYDIPSRCAERLRSRETDVALIPSVELARSPEPYDIVPNVGISSIGPVRSVLLILKRDPDKVRSLALDTSSRTSAALSRIVLEKAYGCRPETFEHAPDPERMLARADAALLVGDPALHLELDGYRTMDLGKAWAEMTGLPFVYACWTGRSGALDPGEARSLFEAKEIGVREIPEIATAFAQSHPQPASFYSGYLSRNIHYDLGEGEIVGLNRFHAYAHELGLIERVPEIGFYPSG